METGIAPCHGIDDDVGWLAADGAGRFFRIGFHVPKDGTAGRIAKCEIHGKSMAGHRC